MAEELRMALVDMLRKAGVEQADFLREGVRVPAQELMELEVAEQCWTGERRVCRDAFH